jgi:tRNA threonylcarbamoyladenosine modification (KEOPS) complex  Pcc1 subunit
MVKPSKRSSDTKPVRPYTLTVTLHTESPRTRDTMLAVLKPEFASIDSKRVRLLVNSNQNHIVFHLAATDVTALRAAATSLMRLYTVADGVHQFMVKKNG